jgi:hypothetical protein
VPTELTKWIADESEGNPYFSANFWIIWSDLDLKEFTSLGRFSQNVSRLGPLENGTQVSITKRSGREVSNWFWFLPISKSSVKFVLSFGKARETTGLIYKLLSRFQGKAQLYPIGHELIRAAVRVSRNFRFEDTEVLRGVSYPSPPNEGGAEIDMLPGNARDFFDRVSHGQRLIKLVRVKTPYAANSFCEYTVNRIGCLSLHAGSPEPFLAMLTEHLAPRIIEAARPYKKATGQFVTYSFPTPIFASPDSYDYVVNALKRLPHSAVAVLHANPYFHALLTNYEDGRQFDIYITDPSTIFVEGHGDIQPASFVRLQNNISLIFQDASVAVEGPKKVSLREFLGEHS